MKDNTSFLILIFYSELADVQCKGIEQRFSQDIFLAASEKAADSQRIITVHESKDNQLKELFRRLSRCFAAFVCCIQFPVIHLLRDFD